MPDLSGKNASVCRGKRPPNDPREELSAPFPGEPTSGLGSCTFATSNTKFPLHKSLYANYRKPRNCKTPVEEPPLGGSFVLCQLLYVGRLLAFRSLRDFALNTCSLGEHATSLHGAQTIIHFFLSQYLQCLAGWNTRGAVTPSVEGSTINFATNAAGEYRFAERKAARTVYSPASISSP